jgi:subtilisin family serine protease
MAAADALLEQASYHIVHRYKTGWLLLDRLDSAAGGDPSRELESRVREFEASDRFAHVQFDGVVTTQLEPEDAAFSDGRLWGLRNFGQDSGVPGADINVGPAWGLTTGSTNVIVAVIDTGISLTHEDLRAQLWVNEDEIPNNNVDDDNNGYIDDRHGMSALWPTNVTSAGDPTDDHRHGTHCAGTIGAAANNGYEHVGVAWDVRLMGCKFIYPTGAGFESDGVEAIEYAVANGANILSCSWGGLGFSQLLYDAFAAAGEAGVLAVVAAGNNRADLDQVEFSPAGFDLPNIITVAAIDRLDELAVFSNYGVNKCDVAAPGVDILSCDAFDDRGYLLASGTSMACPHVAGIAALVRAYRPKITMDEWRQRIVATATPTAALARRVGSGGRVNAFKALTADEDNALEVTVSVANGSALQGGSTEAFMIPAGASNAITMTVHDLRAVTNASARVRFGMGPWIGLRNDGMWPDQRAADHTYALAFSVPVETNAVELAWEVIAPGKFATNGVLLLRPVHRPPNDDFDNRQLLVGTKIHLTGTVTAATREPGERQHNFLPIGGSVWYAWSSPVDGYISIKLSSQVVSPVLEVYTGLTVSSLRRAERRFEDWHRFIPGSHVPVRAGIFYAIAIEDRLGEAGTFDLELAFHPGETPMLPPEFTVHPASRTVEAGTEVFFDSFVISPIGSQYQWYFNGTALPFRTSSTLQFFSASNSLAGDYFVIVSNAFGMATSSVAKLTVVPATPNPSYAFDDFEPDLDGRQWSRVRGGIRATDYGGSVSGVNSLWFEPTANGAVTRAINAVPGVLIRFWLRTGSGTSPNWTAGDPRGAVGLSYSGTGITPRLFASFPISEYRHWRLVEVAIPPEAQVPDVRFSWYMGEDDFRVGHWALDDLEIVTYTNARPPLVARDIQDVTVVQGTQWNLHFDVEGSGPWAFRWHRNGTFVNQLFPESRFYGGGYSPAETGAYFVIASNALGAVTSRVAQVTVRPEPTVAEALDLTNLVVTLNSNAIYVMAHRGVIDETHDGIDALEIPLYWDDRPAPTIRATVHGPGELTFWWRSAVDPPFRATYSFYVDGEERAFVSNNSRWRFVRVELTEGEHAMRWSVDDDDEPFSIAHARAWLDQVIFTPALPRAPEIIAVRGVPPLDNVIIEGGALAFEAVSLGNGLSYQWQRDGTNIPGAIERKLVIAAATVAHRGVYTVTVSNSLGVAQSAAFEITVVNPFEHRLNLGMAVDATNFLWTTSAETPWVVVTNITRDGFDAARSSDITNEYVTWLQTEVTGPGKLTFWWKASTEFTFDQLTLYDNGRPVRYVDGEVDWRREEMELDTGLHVLRWEYIKDDIGAGAADRVWLDEVSFVPGPISHLALAYALNQPELNWRTDAALPWQAQTNVRHDGVAAASSGMLPTRSSNGLEIDITGPATIAFWWKLSSQGSWNAIGIAVDGKDVLEVRGDTDWQPAAAAVPQGTHRVRWWYRQDSGYYLGASQAFLDEVRIIPDEVRFVAGHGHGRLELSGPIGQLVVVESSVDLLSWEAAATNFVNSLGTLQVELPLTNRSPASLFFRARFSQPP